LSDTYLCELEAELAAVGIQGVRRRRIIAETADHLRESGGPARFGEPALIAARFADELATSGSRRIGFIAFGALAPAALVYAALFSLVRPGPDITSARTLPLGIAAAVVMLLAPQVSLAAGLLAVARARRLRSETSAPAAALDVLQRRAAVALGFGAAALAGIALYAFEYSAGLPAWWAPGTIAAAGVALLPVGYAAVALSRTNRLEPQTPGPAGDLFEDLAPVLDRIPLGLRGHPWRLCLSFATAVAAAALIGGGLDEGPRNAVGEFVAICGGFAAFGRFLGLRR